MVSSSRSKHLLKDGDDTRECCRRKTSEMANKMFPVDGTKLIGDDMTAHVHEATCHAERKRLAPGRERRDDDGAKMRVEVVGRHHDTGSSFLDLGAARWIQVDEEDLSAADQLRGYHCHSVSSKWVGVGGSSSLSPPSS